MVALRCTRKLALLLNATPMPAPKPSTTALGDWYGNVVPTTGGTLAVFVNERTLLAVAVPLGQGHDLIPFFYRRVANLLSMIGVSDDLIERELQEMQILQLAKASNRRVLSAMNQVAFELQGMADRVPEGAKLSLSDTELELSNYPHGALRLTSPAKVARELITSTGMWRDT
jgi:hypothetical protein